MVAAIAFSVPCGAKIFPKAQENLFEWENERGAPAKNIGRCFGGL
jgi:hypothetical protein